MKALALALILAIPTIDVADDIQQSIDETGVYLGLFYGCYHTDEDGLVCILPEKEENDQEGVDNETDNTIKS